MRRWLKWLLVAVTIPALLVATLLVAVAWAYVSSDVDTVGDVEFDRHVAVPPLAESHVDEQGRRVFDLTMQQGETDLGREQLTGTWGVNGSYLGPTLRASRGEEVLVNVSNELDETSTLHWHGMHLPAAMDGGPHQMIEDGATWSPSWRIDQPAASLWYHPHQMGKTAEHVYRGVAGMFLLDDPAEAAVQRRLPSTYGVDDLPVIVQDKRFDGSRLDLDRGFFDETGLRGDTVLVNGTPGAYLEVTTERVRLRLLNASNARVYNFHFSDDREYDVVASGGGLLPAPVRRSHLQLSPGERAEVVVTLEPGETTVLRSAPLETKNSNRFAGDDDRLDIMQLRAADRLQPSPRVPDRLAPAPDVSADDVVRTREFRMDGHQINGNQMDMQRIDTKVAVGTTERWRVRASDGPHSFHVHDTQFVIESVDGEPPPPELAGWKDTVYLPAQREVELLVRFTDYVDPDTPYMYHCHLLRHEDEGMMGQFLVVDPSAQGMGDEQRARDRELEHHEPPDHG